MLGVLQALVTSRSNIHLPLLLGCTSPGVCKNSGQVRSTQVMQSVSRAEFCHETQSLCCCTAAVAYLTLASCPAEVRFA